MVPFYLKTFSLLEIKKLVRPFGISKNCLVFVVTPCRNSLLSVVISSEKNWLVKR